ncbi:MAG: hypothetical protein LBH87_02110 [Coriobacteriales bacterium]|nr:hypothetical protein [Coriobacteriales bacterium]
MLPESLGSSRELPEGRHRLSDLQIVATHLPRPTQDRQYVETGRPCQYPEIVDQSTGQQVRVILTIVCVG